MNTIASPTQQIQTACPLCGSKKITSEFEKFGYTLARCTECHFLHVNPTPSEEELRQHYQNMAYFEGEEDQGYRNYADMRKALIPHFERRFGRIRAEMGATGKLLDFGCAAGYFLEIIKKAGWAIVGVELSEEMGRAASELLKIPIYTSLQQLPEPKFDAITLWEVIEHVPKPVEQLREFYDRLRPGGMLMLSTPNNGHWQALRQPDAWIVYRPPSHLNYFDTKTLQVSLQKAGFERIQIQGTMPLPPLPGWLQRLSEPLHQQLGDGSARYWRLALYSWRAIRLAGWLWQKTAHPQDDVFTTLEAIAFRPQ